MKRLLISLVVLIIVLSGIYVAGKKGIIPVPNRCLNTPPGVDVGLSCYSIYTDLYWQIGNDPKKLTLTHIEWFKIPQR